jgi:hypothetical protein
MVAYFCKIGNWCPFMRLEIRPKRTVNPWKFLRFGRKLQLIGFDSSFDFPFSKSRIGNDIFLLWNSC